jgi:hypothetical protein
MTDLDTAVRYATRKAAVLLPQMRVFPPPKKRLYQFYVGVQKFQFVPDERRVIVNVAYGFLGNTEFASVEDYWVHTIGVLENPRVGPVDKIKELIGFERALAANYRNPAMPQEQKKVLFEVNSLINQLLAHAPESHNVLPAPKAHPTKDDVLSEQRALEERLFLDARELDKFYKYTERRDIAERTPLGKPMIYTFELTNLVFS